MIPQLHWHEGLFLLPHHLQHLQHAVSQELSELRQQTVPYAFGVRELLVSLDELANFRLRFERLRVILPSGLEVCVNHNAEVPEMDLKPLFATRESSFLISLAVPTWQSKRSNAFEIGAPIDPRVKLLFCPRETTLLDENTGENPKSVFLRKINARLLTERDDRSDLEVIPLLRLVRASGDQLGSPRIDTDFIPPTLFLEGSTGLFKLVRDLAHQVEASRKELGVQLTRGGFSLETMRGVQYEQLLRFRTLRRFGARLQSLLEAPRIAPFTWYLELRSLEAELAALHPEIPDAELQSYQHEGLAGTFHGLDSRIRFLLKCATGGSFLRAEFVSEGSFLAATLTDEQLTRPIEYYLAIASKDDPRAIIRLVEDPDQFKLMPRSFVNRAVRGMVLKEERVPPMNLPAQAGLTYFRVCRPESARVWQQILADHTAVVRWPEMEKSDFKMTLYMTVVG